ncbi:bifunctional lysylphosphatidylglycerol flippase/synthetase MprF [Arcanobacterium ihumii]|uniref:bifunctional lysylphosphatidylglycerol flippase/synthetase MprF n=1 Tax=Arcanobacterium ihumii TaxID=2138162 RepID=UPI000F52E6E0|nr:bifunctional lysylphosphatidylglycerol flippase/synthetase MprF [Arcanobacterium ihumii]
MEDSRNTQSVFGKVKEFAVAHKVALTRIFYVVMIIAVVLVAKRELSSISGAEMRQLFAEQHPSMIIGILVLGVLAFTATGIYDFYAVKHFEIDVPRHRALRIGWIAQAFNNFAGLGGLTGGTLRTKHYTTNGIETRTALNITLAVWAANLLGLFAIILATAPIAYQWEGTFMLVPLLGCLYLPFYFWGQHINIGKIKLGQTFLARQNFKQKLEMLIASVADWLAAAVFFWLCIRLFAPDAGLAFTLFVYSTATIIGLASMLPAGIGSFDLTVISLFAVADVDTTKLLLGVVLFRIAYYVVPWLLALILSVNEFADTRRSLRDEYRKGGFINSVIWIGTAFCGIVLVVSTLTPDNFLRAWKIAQIIPDSIRGASSLTSLLIGISLVVLSIGLRARIRRIYWAALILLVAGAIGAIAKGLDYEEAALLLVFAIMLYLGRNNYDAEPLHPTPVKLIFSAIAIIGIPFAIIEMRHYIFHSKSLYLRIINPSHPVMQIAFYSAFVLAIVFILMFSRSKKLSFVAPDEKEVNRFHDFLLHHPGNSYSYLFALGDKQVYYTEDESVALLYRPHKGTLLVLGDPIGETSRFDEALDEFLGFAHRHDMNVAFYEISGKFLENLVEQGLRFVKIGEDASLELDTYSNIGNSGKIFRRMRNRMSQNGTEFEMLYPPYDEETFAELRRVSDSWLGNREEMAFSLGFFDEAYLSSGPIAVVRSAERIEGFANVVFLNDDAVTFDLMRFRPDSPGGTMDGIMVSLIEWAKDAGFKEINLGMAPLSNVGRKIYSHGAEKIVRYVHDFGNRVYNFRGLRAYKEKFKPRWDSRYLVYSSNRSLPSALLGLLEVINRPAKYTTSDDTRCCREYVAELRIPRYENSIEDTVAHKAVQGGNPHSPKGSTRPHTANKKKESSETFAK